MMKQGNFIIEFVQIKDYLLYIVRSTNGQIVKVCHDLSILLDFLHDMESKVLSADGKA